MDTCITIRTIVCATASRYVQAGAGIVADSDPERSTRRRRTRRRALRRAVDAGRDGGVRGDDRRVLVIDNYDCFTYNLVQYLGALGAEVEVRRNDAIDVERGRARCARRTW